MLTDQQLLSAGDLRHTICLSGLHIKDILISNKNYLHKHFSVLFKLRVLALRGQAEDEPSVSGWSCVSPPCGSVWSLHLVRATQTLRLRVKGRPRCRHSSRFDFLAGCFSLQFFPLVSSQLVLLLLQTQLLQLQPENTNFSTSNSRS